MEACLGASMESCCAPRFYCDRNEEKPDRATLPSRHDLIGLEGEGVAGESSIEATKTESQADSGATSMPDSMADVDAAPPEIGPQIDLSWAMNQPRGRGMLRQMDESAVLSGKRPWQQVLAERNVLQPEDLDYTVLGTQRTQIVGAQNRGITLAQLRRVRQFIQAHTTDEEGTLAWLDLAPAEFNVGRLRTASINLYQVRERVVVASWEGVLMSRCFAGHELDHCACHQALQREPCRIAL